MSGSRNFNGKFYSEFRAHLSSDISVVEEVALSCKKQIKGSRANVFQDKNKRRIKLIENSFIRIYLVCPLRKFNILIDVLTKQAFYEKVMIYYY